MLVLDCSWVVLPISGISQHAANTARLGIFRFFHWGKRRWGQIHAFHKDARILIMTVLGKVFQVQAAMCG